MNMKTFIFFLFSFNCFSQTGFVSDGLIHLPSVIVNGQNRSLTLQVVPDKEPIQVMILQDVENTSSANMQSSVLNGSILEIKQLEFEHEFYSGEFRKIDHYTYEIVTVKINDTPFGGFPTARLGFTPLYPDAHDIGVGVNGDVWVTESSLGNGRIWRFEDKTWEIIPGMMAKRIDVDANGNPWVVTLRGEIFRYQNQRWHPIPGNGGDIGIGADGSIYKAGSISYEYSLPELVNGPIAKWENGRWDYLPGEGRNIDVDGNGIPYVVSSEYKAGRYQGNVFRFINGRWEDMVGDATDIGAGPEGSVWIDTTDALFYRWNGATWDRFEIDERFDDNGSVISVGPYGEPWSVFYGKVQRGF